MPSQVIDTLSLVLSQGLDALGIGIAVSLAITHLLAHHRGLCVVCVHSETLMDPVDLTLCPSEDH